MECKYIVYGQEVGEQGTPHLQGFVSFTNAKTYAAANRMFNNRCHLDVKSPRSTFKQAIDYCFKLNQGEGIVPNEVVVERGTRPLDKSDIGNMEKQRWGDCLKRARDGDIHWIEENHPDLFVRYEHRWKKYKMESNKPEDLESLDNYYFWGSSGVGKSRGVRKLYPDFYTKELNKWWDGYNDEDVVLIDDLDPDSAKYMVKKLKNWADHYAFPAEVKGGARLIRPKKIIITSNYPIRELGLNERDLMPILRRFKQIEVTPQNKLMLFG